MSSSRLKRLPALVLLALIGMLCPMSLAASLQGVDEPYVLGSHDVVLVLEDGEPPPDDVIFQVWSNVDNKALAGYFDDDASDGWNYPSAKIEEVGVKDQVFVQALLRKDGAIYKTVSKGTSLVTAVQTIDLSTDQAFVQLIIRPRTSDELDLTSVNVDPESGQQNTVLWAVHSLKVEVNNDALLAAIAELRAEVLDSKSEAVVGEKINVNTASIELLTELPGIGLAKAGAIVNNRENFGPFGSLEELIGRVSGIGPKTVEGLRPYATVDSSE